MKKFILLLGLSATVIPHPLAWAGGPVVQLGGEELPGGALELCGAS